MRSEERGAILIQVAISILVLTALSTFALDYGVLWLGRAQAQNAADAGALAGAIARAFDEPTDPPAVGGVTYQSAINAAQANLVVRSAPAAAVVPPEPGSGLWDCPSWAGGGRCVTVEVYRDVEHDNALPTVFGVLFGQSTQDMQATATAQASPANASDCLRPWGIPDKWIENNPVVGAPWTSTSTYDHYYTNGQNAGTEIPNPDLYTAPSEGDAGTGFTIDADYGQELTLKFGAGRSDISPGWYLPVDIPRADGAPVTGGDRYRENIASCNGLPITIGTYLPTETGAKVGPTAQGVDDLMKQDPFATWVPDAEGGHIEGSCAPTCAPTSPRIVALPVFDPDEYQKSDATRDWSGCPGGGTCVRVVNILGFFVDHFEGTDVVGYLIRTPGVMTTVPGGVTPPASFITVIRLIR